MGSELEASLQKISSEKRILDQLCTDFTAIYDVDLSTGAFDVFHLATGTNAKRIIGGSYQSFDELTDRYVDSFLYPEERERFRSWLRISHLREELQNKTRITMHYHSMPSPSGQQYYEAQVVRSAAETERDHALIGFRCIDGIMEKETAAQRALQHALDQAELRYEIISAIAKAYTSIYRIDLTTDTFEEIANDDATRQVAGCRGCASAMLRRVCDTLIAPEYRSAVWPVIDLSTVGERLRKDEMIVTEYKMCDGSWHRLRFIIKKQDAAGRVTHILLTIRSTSDTKMRELHLLYEAEAAKRERDMKTRFLANMSHDIRTPLNGLIGLMNMARQHADDLEMQARIREKSVDALQYLVSLVNDVLDMTKLENDDLSDEKISFSLVDVLEDANLNAQEKAEKKGIQYKIEWKNGDLRHSALFGNPVYLTRVLNNVADNAVKFSEAGSTIWVWADEEALDETHVQLRFYCQDQGRGMDEETRKNAFSMFTQGTESSHTSYEGTGLGLAIAKKLVDRMNGSIELESALGVGTKVTISIPFELAPVQEDPAARSTADFDVKGIRALVAEDNELNMEIVKMMLENQGILVTPAKDGQEAAEIFAHSAPDYFGVVYMDLMMPRLDGLGAARAIRAMHRPDARKVPIIAMSANAFAEDVINSRMAGMNRHIAKPLTEEKMIRALQQCLAERADGRDILRLREDL